MGLLTKHIPPAYINRLLNSPKALRYSIPHLKERAKQDLEWGDTLAYQRTMIRLTMVEQEVDRYDYMLEKMLEQEQKKQ